MQVSKHDAKSDLLIYEGRVGNEKIKVLVDPGATHNFVASTLVQKLQLKTVLKTNADTVRFADGSVALSRDATRLDFVLACEEY